MKKPKLDSKRIAKALGAEREGRVSAKSGYFGAMQLVAVLSGISSRRRRKLSS